MPVISGAYMHKHKKHTSTTSTSTFRMRTEAHGMAAKTQPRHSDHRRCTGQPHAHNRPREAHRASSRALELQSVFKCGNGDRENEKAKTARLGRGSTGAGLYSRLLSCEGRVRLNLTQNSLNLQIFAVGAEATCGPKGYFHKL